MPTVFFSWQSDRGNADRSFIEKALQTAIKRISKDLEIDEDPRDPLELDKDTKGVPGSPNIFDTIRAKIGQAAVIVADLTFVASRVKGEPSPNPNVLIEYGYALKSLSPSRIIGVMNASFGAPSRDTLPFDLASYRFPITFEREDGASEEERKAERDKLTDTLEQAIRNVLDSQEYKDSLPKSPPSPPIKYREPLQGRARFWPKGEPVGYAHNPLRRFQGQADEPVEIAEGPAIWLRLMPRRPISERFKIDQLQTIAMPLVHAPLYSSYSNTLPLRGAEGTGLCTPLGDELSPSLVYVFTDAEIWALDTYPFQALPIIISLEEDRLSETMKLFAKFLSETLQIPPPYRWVVGLEGIKGRSLRGANYGVRGPCLVDLVEVDGMFNAGDDPATLLEPFFQQVFEQCGVTRPAKRRST
jgi:hypothetical protein